MNAGAHNHVMVVGRHSRRGPARLSPTPLRRSMRIAVGALSVLLLLAAWQAAVDLSGVSPRVMASPAQIAAEFAASWTDVLGPATLVTGLEGLIGFLLAVPVGIGLGILLYLSPLASAALSPLLVTLQTLPLIAVAPLFVIWFGFEPGGKVVMVLVLSFFPIAVQTTRGLLAVPRFYEDVALTCGAGRAWTLFHVRLRVAARQILGGMRIAAVYVYGTAVTAEYLGARQGLGIVLQTAFNSFRTPLILAATVIIVALTGLLVGLVGLIERFWAVESTADYRA